MDIAYLHLVTNHIPIIGVPFAIALLAVGLWRKSHDLKTAAFMAFAALGILTVVVYLLGQGGEDFVEDLPGVSHDSIEDHERAATFALISVLATAVPAAFALVRYRLIRRPVEESTPSFPRWIVLVTLALALGSAAILGYTGHLGGKIRHTEFHGGTTAAEENDEENDGERGEPGRRRGRNRGGR